MKVYYSQLDNQIFLYTDKECENEHSEIYFTLEQMIAEMLGIDERDIKQGEI